MNRPRTLHDVAARSDSIEEFGRNFQDWLHTLRTFSSRNQAVDAVKAEHGPLAERFASGEVADAYLAAYAEYLCNAIGASPPPWAEGRISSEPWFAVGNDTFSPGVPPSRRRNCGVRMPNDSVGSGSPASSN